MTLDGTGVRRTELTRLKVSDIDSRRKVVHIQDGKGGQDRDLMLSPVLLEELRAHWRRLRNKSVWLFPGNRWHSSDHPMDDKTLYHDCVEAARRSGTKKRIYPHVLLNTVCPSCGHSISPAEIRRIDCERMKCPTCGSVCAEGESS